MPRDKTSRTAEPPQTLRRALTFLGPGLVLTASVVGSGELIATTSLGARVGFLGLWLITLSCVAKLPLQLLLGRWAILHDRPLLDELDGLPGPRLRAGWFTWLWLVAITFVTFQQGAMLGGVGQALHLLFPAVGVTEWAFVVAAATIALLWGGGYARLEHASLFMVAAFAASTVTCVAFLAGSPYAFSPADLLQGLRFELPSDGAAIALAIFGITGIGTTELALYPYWCQQKGYARWAGKRDDSPAWRRRADGWIRIMRLDSVVAMATYTTLTMAFFVLGAAVLHPQGLFPEGSEMIVVLSRMYTESFGPGAYYVFLAGALFALYSTIFVSTAAHGRMFADCSVLFGWSNAKSEEDRRRLTRAFTTGLPVAQLLLLLAFQLPVWMVLVGGTAQSLIMPVLGFCAVYLMRRRMAELPPPGWMKVLGWMSAGVTAAVALWGLAGRVAN